MTSEGGGTGSCYRLWLSSVVRLLPADLSALCTNSDSCGERRKSVTEKPLFAFAFAFAFAWAGPFARLRDNSDYTRPTAITPRGAYSVGVPDCADSIA